MLETQPTPTQSITQETDYEDEIVAQARAFDIMHDELYMAWADGGQVGPNPDNLPREAVSNAYRDMIAKQRAGQNAQER